MYFILQQQNNINGQTNFYECCSRHAKCSLAGHLANQTSRLIWCTGYVHKNFHYHHLQLGTQCIVLDKFQALLAVWKTEGKGLEGPNTCTWNKPLQNSCDCQKARAWDLLEIFHVICHGIASYVPRIKVPLLPTITFTTAYCRLTQETLACEYRLEWVD